MEPEIERTDADLKRLILRICEELGMTPQAARHLAEPCVKNRRKMA
ncbi:hypothetical protein [Paracoccus sp. (in: a-proteobacteria)]|nr:hypothetical protein [Paracoccus sp. (in: a-proteobacteria)]